MKTIVSLVVLLAIQSTLQTKIALEIPQLRDTDKSVQYIRAPAKLPPVPQGTSCDTFARSQIQHHFSSCNSVHYNEKYPRNPPKGFNRNSCEPENKANACVLEGFFLMMDWSSHCKTPKNQIGSFYPNFYYCQQQVTPGLPVMKQLIESMGVFCKKETLNTTDSCAAYWTERDCQSKFYFLQSLTFLLGNKKHFKHHFDIKEAPCSRKVTFPEVPKGKTCLQVARAEIVKYNDLC